MSARCLACGSEVPHRNAVDGAPLGSNSLSSMDKEYHFCTLRCAARWGINNAKAHHGGATGERAKLREEDRKRWDALKELQARGEDAFSKIARGYKEPS